MPSQERSQALVDAVLVAASHVLAKLGVERSTTTRIAERAGVSVGSVYQYFRDRDDLIGTLVERRFEENLARFEREMARDESPLAFIDGIVRAGLATYLDERSFYLSLLSYAPLRSRLPAVIFARKRAARVLARKLRERSEELAPVDPDVAGFVLINAFMGVALMAVHEDPPHREALHTELVRMFSRYLLRNGAA
jgi:AcrR family transcriptional regulator